MHGFANSTCYPWGLAYVIRELIALGTVVVTGSGNSVGHPKGYPALFGSPNNRNYIPGLIVVGSVFGNGGRHLKFSEADWLSCYAAGSAVMVPEPLRGFGNDAYTHGSGTSFGKVVSFLAITGN